VTFRPDDAVHMAHALRLAARGLGNVWPNPAVGCVIVKDGVIVGRGWTQPGGRPHAEVRALQQAGARAAGATAYVTLEPCAHHGHTPPLRRGFDGRPSHPRGDSLDRPRPARLWQGPRPAPRSAGIDVTEGVLQPEATHLNAGFLKRVTQGLPFVTLKLATSLDGRTATATGESRWITGPEARRKVHAMRLAHDAVMVGSGTALADDPDLTVRDMGAVRQPVRIVLDRMLKLSSESRLGRTAKDHPVWLLHSPSAPEAARTAWKATGATLIETTETGGQLELTTALQILAQKGLTRILSEGGSTAAAALVKAGLVDELAMFTGGMLIGADGTPTIASLSLEALADAPRFTLRETQIFGRDTFSLWSV
jgi:diaminohydroxyphosphoribosylaminopyrimidine deaminase / 5-amino-6-(5-phosphoribosylamino)uracil reductase